MVEGAHSNSSSEDEEEKGNEKEKEKEARQCMFAGVGVLQGETEGLSEVKRDGEDTGWRWLQRR